MTMIEKITKDRAWRGARVTLTMHGDRVAYFLEHSSGATAYVFKEPGDMDSRKWVAWAWRQECARIGCRLPRERKAKQ